MNAIFMFDPDDRIDIQLVRRVHSSLSQFLIDPMMHFVLNRLLGTRQTAHASFFLRFRVFDPAENIKQIWTGDCDDMR